MRKNYQSLKVSGAGYLLGWIMGLSPELKNVHRTLFYPPYGRAALFEPIIHRIP